MKAKLVVPAKTDLSTVAVRPVRSLRRVPGLPSRGMHGVNISPVSAEGAPISLRITLSRRLASNGAVIGFGPGGRDVHRLPTFGRRVDVPVIGQMSIVVLPEARRSAWFRASFTRHMPKSPQFKLEHVLAALTSDASRGAKAASLTANTASTSAIIAANLNRYREYISWLQAKYAHDPATSVQTVAPAWLEMLHHLAVASELGLVDKDEVDKQTREFYDFYRRVIDAWLSQLREPCLRTADLDTAVRLHRTAALNGIELATTLEDLNRCPYEVSGDISITTYQDLMSDRANGGSKVIEASTQLHVRLLATWLGLVLPSYADDGTTVDYTGSLYFSPFSDSGPCEELIARNYFLEQDQFGPYAGPVTSIEMAAGDTGVISLSARWGYTSHNSIQTLFPTTNGCDWSNAQEDTSRVEEVQVLGRANQNGLEYSFKTQWPVDPFTTVDGKLTAHEVVG